MNKNIFFIIQFYLLTAVLIGQVNCSFEQGELLSYNDISATWDTPITVPNSAGTYVAWPETGTTVLKDVYGNEWTHAGIRTFYSNSKYPNYVDGESQRVVEIGDGDSIEIKLVGTENSGIIRYGYRGSSSSMGAGCVVSLSYSTVENPTASDWQLLNETTVSDNTSGVVEKIISDNQVKWIRFSYVGAKTTMLDNFLFDSSDNLPVMDCSFEASEGSFTEPGPGTWDGGTLGEFTVTSAFGSNIVILTEDHAKTGDGSIGFGYANENSVVEFATENISNGFGVLSFSLKAWTAGGTSIVRVEYENELNERVLITQFEGPKSVANGDFIDYQLPIYKNSSEINGKIFIHAIDNLDNSGSGIVLDDLVLTNNLVYTFGFEPGIGLEHGLCLSFTDGNVNWDMSQGATEISVDHADGGLQSLVLLPGSQVVEIDFSQQFSRLDSVAFTAKLLADGEYQFSVEKYENSTWSSLGDTGVLTTSNQTISFKDIDSSTVSKLRLSSTSNSGVMIDDFSMSGESLATNSSMMLKEINAYQEPKSIPKGTISEVMLVDIYCSGFTTPKSVTQLDFDLSGTVDVAAISRLEVYSVGSVKSGINERLVTSIDNLSVTDNILTIDEELTAGHNYFSVRLAISETATLNETVDIICQEVKVDNDTISVTNSDPTSHYLVSYSLPEKFVICRQGQDSVHTYRIPGLVTTKAGSLIAVFDMRYNGTGDLPGDIDVGMRRSTDMGKTWSDIEVIMDMGNDPAFNYDGIGDPTILVDDVTGTIWVAATWSHGNRSWHGSGPGLEPEETGQFMLVKSEDDGLSWSDPINITKQVKNPIWNFLLQGPGSGITMRDGTLVFPAQFRDENGTPHSTIIYSRDRGETWHCGIGAKPNTTEAQVVELNDGSLMLNMRTNGSDYRSVYVSDDLGASWTEHQTSTGLGNALPGPVCQASFLRYTSILDGYVKDRVLFSNPSNTSSRNNMYIQMSTDEGESWTVKKLLKAGPAAYSSLTILPDGSIGLIYETNDQGTSVVETITYYRFSLDWLTNGHESFDYPTGVPTVSSVNSLFEVANTGLKIIDKSDFNFEEPQVNQEVKVLYSKGLAPDGENGYHLTDLTPSSVEVPVRIISDDGIYSAPIMVSVQLKKAKSIDMNLTRLGNELTWLVNDETGVSHYEVVDVLTGIVLANLPVDQTGSYSYLLPVDTNAIVRAVMTDQSSKSQAFAPNSDLNKVMTVYELSTGWNLIAAVGENGDFSAFAEGVMWKWENGNYSIFTEPKDQQGFWFYSETEKIYIVEADESLSESMSYTTGWNLLGVNEENSAPNGSHINYIWNGYYQEVAADESFLPGTGFWSFISN